MRYAVRVPARSGRGFTLGGGNLGEKLALILSSDDVSALDASVKALERELRGIPGLSNITSTASLQRSEIVVRPHLTLATEQGISTAAIAATVRFATTGDLDTELPRLDLDNPARRSSNPSKRSAWRSSAEASGSRCW